MSKPDNVLSVLLQSPKYSKPKEKQLNQKQNFEAVIASEMIMHAHNWCITISSPVPANGEKSKPVKATPKHVL